ncbi:MAG: hypothetical protein M1393_08500 [Candidatus Thermoplasmatota archaeon]|nr:hypothetical protein [Candidatus Thermoplasmatota archaeon]
MDIQNLFGSNYQFVLLLLTLSSGLFIGLALKKGLMSVVLGVVGYLIASYIALPLIPTISVSSFAALGRSYAGLIQFNSPILSFSLVVFAIGLGLGIWRG